MIGKAESLRIADLEGHGKISPSGAADGFVDQGCADINPGNLAAGPNPAGNIKGVVARAATHIQDPSARHKVKAFTDRRLPCDRAREFVRFV